VRSTFFSPLPLLTSPRSASTVIPLEIWDCPGNITLDSLGISLSEFSSVIFVIDIQVLSLSFVQTSPDILLIQDSYQQPIARMLDFFIAAYQENPATTLEVFVHKAESLAEDYKIGTLVL
jgi:Ras-related GTP-binding protein C/D